MKIGLGRPAPEYDPNYTCPLEASRRRRRRRRLRAAKQHVTSQLCVTNALLQVVNEHFVDHIIELEKSKSYPGLSDCEEPYS